MPDSKRRSVGVWIVPLLAALIGFYRVTQSPSFPMYRTVDLVQLIGCGACIGAAMVGVIFMFRGSRA
jgi:hypothetical protein